MTLPTTTPLSDAEIDPRRFIANVRASISFAEWSRRGLEVSFESAVLVLEKTLARAEAAEEDLRRTREALVLCENSLSCFLESADFVVSVGGNPIVVHGMLESARNGMARARAILTPPPPQP